MAERTFAHIFPHRRQITAIHFNINDRRNTNDETYSSTSVKVHVYSCAVYFYSTLNINKIPDNILVSTF